MSTAAAAVEAPGMPDLPGGPFKYLFPDAAGPTHSADISDKLAALATAMIETDAQNQSGALDSNIPPIFTYFGQFIDHDITANTDRAAGASKIDGDLTPLPRPQVTSEVHNLRKGSLGLDSLYGDGPAQDAFAKKLEGLMRHPTFKSKMRLGLATEVPGRRPALPADPAVDVLRLGKLVDDGTVTLADINALPDPGGMGFLKPDGTPNIQKAIIGDGRNDENLIVAQLQVAFLRFHNKVVDWIAAQPGAPSDPDALFEEARKMVRWHYQWLVVNDFLPRICDPAIVDQAKQYNAPNYSGFYDRCHEGNAEHMPMPLEFSVAAYRYGHTMVRGRYDYNQFFGRPGDLVDFNLIFLFTGRGDSPLANRPTLPSDWIIEWDRFVRDNPDHPDRTARKIDTLLAPPLANMLNEEGPDFSVFRQLAERNLKRGHRLNIPTAQAIIAAMGGTYSGVTPLTEAELTSGATGAAISDGNLVNETPLWFYILKEAEVKGQNGRLGPLGSVLVADTLVGLAVKDPTSYWHESGSHDGKWGPSDGAKPEGKTITGFEAMLEATGQLDASTS